VARVKAGDLDKRITLLVRADAEKKVGAAPKPTFTPGDSYWAKVGPIKYLKATILRGLQLSGDFEAELRLRRTITAAHRVRYRGVDYAITHVVHDDRDDKTVLLLQEAP
jgi:SPP1 family predicted phage head-tail adaptor